MCEKVLKNSLIGKVDSNLVFCTDPLELLSVTCFVN